MKSSDHFLRCIAVSLCLLHSQYAAAQQGPKIIPGVFRGEHWDEDFKVLQVTPDGSRVTFEQFRRFHTLLLKEGRFVTAKPKWTGRLSPDQTYTYTNQPGIDDGRSNFGSYETGPNKVALVYGAVLARLEDDNPLKVFIDTNFIVGMNTQNQLIVSTAWTNGSARIKGLKGLRLLDPKTFKELKVLRTDTILHTVPDFYLPRIWFNSTYTALLRQKAEASHSPTMVYPFGTDSVVECEAITYCAAPEAPVDQHYLYENTDSGLNVYSIHSGKMLYRVPGAPGSKGMPYVYRRNLYAPAGNGRLYRYDREQKEVYEEQVTDAGLHTVKTYPLSADNPTFLTDKQWYFMAAAAGPSLVFAPRFRIDGNVPENEGYVLDLPSGKLSLRIAPFFNPDTAQLAQEAYARTQNKTYDQSACDLKLKTKGMVIGSSVEGQNKAGILRKQDCAKKTYTVWVPNYMLSHGQDTSFQIDAASFETAWELSQMKWVACSDCQGSGYTYKEVNKGYTKEVPQGYFSGVTTTVTKSWKETEGTTCRQCKGGGKVRK